MSDTYDHDQSRPCPADPRELISGPDPDDIPEPSCKLVLELLPETVGGDLDPETEGIVSRHLSGCHGCLREWNAFRKAHEGMQSLRTSAESRIDDAFFEGLHKDILGSLRFTAQELVDARKLRKGGRRMQGVRRAGGSLFKVAAFAATLLLGMLVGTYIPGSSSIPGLGERGEPLVRRGRVPLELNQAVDLGVQGFQIPPIPDVTGSIGEAVELLEKEFGARTQLRPELTVVRDF